MLTTADSTSFIIHVVDASGTDYEEVEVKSSKDIILEQEFGQLQKY